MWTIKQDGQIVERERTFVRAKQTLRCLRRAEPDSVWTVADPLGRIVIEVCNDSQGDVLLESS
jgi:hypothetical protein